MWPRSKPENRGYDETARFVDPYSESSAKIGSTERFADRETSRKMCSDE